MGDENDRLDEKLGLMIDHEHRVLVIGLPVGLDRMSDGEILALASRAAALKAEWKEAGYAVEHVACTNPRWQPA